MFGLLLFLTDVKEKVRSFIAVANAKVSFPVAERIHFRSVSSSVWFKRLVFANLNTCGFNARTIYVNEMSK